MAVKILDLDPAKGPDPGSGIPMLVHTAQPPHLTISRAT